MTRLLLTLRYDGTNYHGWQVQHNGVTVQETLQDAIETITGFRSGVIGCSRTDAGVHAEGFCCTFDTESSLRGEQLLTALNAVLPHDIAVYHAAEVAPDFHPRYSAHGKQYVYRIWNGSQRHPAWEPYAVHIARPLKENRLDETAKVLIGTHDFAAFCASGSSVKDTVRTVFDCAVTRQGELVEFRVSANGFLYNMVRIMMGTLLEIADGKREISCIEAAFRTGDRAVLGATAPAKGLCLEQVFYE